MTADANSTRSMAWYFGGLAAAYGAALAVFWPPAGEQPTTLLFLALMLAPTVGALLARFVGGGHIQWGRPNLWILAGLLPVAAVLAVYLLGSLVGWDTEDPSVLSAALAGAPVAIASASLSALGEEIGWRGFLWPTLRTRMTFGRTAVATMVVWWIYHVPLVLLGWYGELSGLPAFTVALVGFTLFVGVLTERSGSLWPSTVAHGGWNGLVATSFAATEGGDTVPAFAGSDALLGEFGWLAAVTMLVLGGLATWWHLGRAPADTKTAVTARV